MKRMFAIGFMLCMAWTGILLIQGLMLATSVFFFDHSPDVNGITIGVIVAYLSIKEADLMLSGRME
jgi:hypothetical protein